MNVRRGLRRVVVVAVIAAEVIAAAINLYEFVRDPQGETFLLWLVTFLGILMLGWIAWRAIDWIIRGFENSD